MGKDIGALFFVYPFFLSSLGGSLVGILLLRLIDFDKLAGKLNIN